MQNTLKMPKRPSNESKTLFRQESQCLGTHKKSQKVGIFEYNQMYLSKYKFTAWRFESDIGLYQGMPCDMHMSFKFHVLKSPLCRHVARRGGRVYSGQCHNAIRPEEASKHQVKSYIQRPQVLHFLWDRWVNSLAFFFICPCSIDS